MDEGIDRRTFLKAGIAGFGGTVLASTGLLTWAPRSHAAVIAKTFYITEGFVTQADGVDVYFRGFSSSSTTLNVPGEQLIVQDGDTVRMTIVNTLGSSHSFVIDGLIDSGPIQGGQTKVVQFVASNPGSYLYHDGLNVPYNRLTGLHGGFAVMPAGSGNELYGGSPTFMQQYFWIFNDIDPAWNRAVQNGQLPTSPYKPRYFTINGLSGRPPGAAGNKNPMVDSMADPLTKLDGHIGDRTLVRCLNAGMVQNAIHPHANHMEWLTKNRRILPYVWEKDVIPLDGNGGAVDTIFPFDSPPDAWPPVTNQTLIQAENEGRHTAFPMHLHNEMTQTSGGGSYLFGALTDIYYHSK